MESAPGSASEHRSDELSAPASPSRSRAARPQRSTSSSGFVKTLVAKGGGAREFTSPRFRHSTRFDPMPIKPTDVDPMFLTSHEDMGERASFHLSMYNTVRTSPYRYGAAFKSTSDRFGDDKGSFLHQTSSPGFLEYNETPRKPSIAKAQTRPATSINGAECERTYASTFKNKYEWPKSIEMPINGGGIHVVLDRRIGHDGHGAFSVYERSIAQEMEISAKQGKFKSAFKAPLKDHTIIKESRLDARSPGYDRAQPYTLERRMVASPMLYSAMTKRSAKDRFKTTKKATDEIFGGNSLGYDIAHSAQPDLAVSVERSPIRYSAFHSTATHPNNIGQQTLASQRPRSQSPSGVRPTPSDASLGSTKRVHCPVWDKATRFLPDGHALSMIPARVCNNEAHDSIHGTIAHQVEKSPVRVKIMDSRSSRTSAVDLCYNPRPGSRLYVTRSKTEWYEDAGKALPDGRMPIADRVASTPQTYGSSLNSLTVRSAVPPSMDPRQTDGHERRRQHILVSHVQTLRGGNQPNMSAKMAKILNLEPPKPAVDMQELQDSAVSSEMKDQRAAHARQSQELQDWLGGPPTLAHIRPVVQEAAGRVFGCAVSARHKNKFGKAGVGEERSAVRTSTFA